MKTEATNMYISDALLKYRLSISSAVYFLSEFLTVNMKQVHPIIMNTSPMISEGWNLSFKKATDNKVLNTTESEQDEESMKRLPIFKAITFKYDPTMSEHIPMIQVSVQNIGLPCNEVSYSLFMWAYFIRTNANELKKLPAEANSKLNDVSAPLSAFSSKASVSIACVSVIIIICNSN